MNNNKKETQNDQRVMENYQEKIIVVKKKRHRTNKDGHKMTIKTLQMTKNRQKMTEDTQCIMISMITMRWSLLKSFSHNPSMNEGFHLTMLEF